MTAATDTPLAEQLGFSRGMRVWFHRVPDAVRDALDPDEVGIDEQTSASDGLQAALLFVVERQKLARELAALRPLLAPNGFIWVSWPVAEAGIDTDIDEDAVRAEAGPAGLVEAKACTLHPHWSGLKLAIARDLL